jgi:transposase
MSRVSDLKREKQIIKLLSSNKGYAEVAKKFGVSRQRIYQIADRNNIIGIRVKKKESRQILVENLKKELENGLSIREMSIKYNLSVEQIKNQFKIETSLSLFSLMVKTRNEKINNDFISGSTAKKIVNDTDKFLSNPVKVTTLDYVYMLNTKKGIKRYPKIGRRCDGGTFEDPKIINFIVYKRDRLGYTFKEIANRLNELGYKTVTNISFTSFNTNVKYNKAKEKLS